MVKPGSACGIHPGPNLRGQECSSFLPVLQYCSFMKNWFASQIATPLTSMLKTSKSTKFTKRPEKNRVRVGDDDGGGRSGDFDMTF